MKTNTVLKGAAGYRARHGLVRKNVDKLAAVIAEARQQDKGKRGRGRPRKGDEWIEASAERSPADLSLIALNWLADSAMRKKPLGRLKAAIALGAAVLNWDTRRRRLSRDEDALAANIGFQVAALAAAPGVELIEDMTPPLRAFKDKTPIRLTPHAVAQVESLLDAAPAVALPEQPTGAPFVKRGVRSRTDPPTPLEPVAQALDLIRATRWRINAHMLLMLQSLHKRSRIDPAKLAQARAVCRHKATADARDLAAARRYCKQAAKETSERAALHTAASLKEPFYLDGHFDFRGRFYQDGLRGLQWTSATDFARALLEFDSGCILDDAGVSSLALYLTSMWGHGVDKLTDPERLAWAEENEAAIVGCVDDVKPSAFWRKAKHRWRFLAACAALRDAFAGKLVHLPCSFDVTCSGIGIYALLLRDARLAQMVGITPSPDGSVQDFYQTVANACPPQMGRNGKLKAVTRAGAKRVIKGTMYGAGENSKGAQNPIRAAMWALMPEGRRLFDWLRAVQARSGVLTWELPDGFTAVNDYRQIDETILEAHVGTRRIQAQYNSTRKAFDRDKAESAIAANFIHSWDGAYLRAVVRLGAAAGIGGWGLAHDCFSVNPQFASLLIQPMGVCQQAVMEVFGPDRLVMLGWGEAPGRRGRLPRGRSGKHSTDVPAFDWRDWQLGHIVG